MSEMVERVAKALLQKFKDKVSSHAGMSFEETNVAIPNQAIWLEYAHAAIEAMQEPTKEMLTAEGVQTNCFTCGGHGEGWERMIAEALK